MTTSKRGRPPVNTDEAWTPEQLQAERERRDFLRQQEAQPPQEIVPLDTTLDLAKPYPDRPPMASVWLYLKRSVAQYWALYPHLTQPEVAKRFHISAWTVWSWLKHDADFLRFFEDACEARLNDAWSVGRTFLETNNQDFLRELYKTAVQDDDYRAKIAAIRLAMEMQGWLNKNTASMPATVQNIHVQVIQAMQAAQAGTLDPDALLAPVPKTIDENHKE